jgi:nucleotide-binding universal stress UspA family protein
MVIEQGSPWEVVSRQIQKQPMDLLVLASHGRRGLRKLVLGSEAERIFRQSSGPVLTVGPRARAIDPGRWTPKTIIFPTDFSPTSLHSLPFALALAEESQATLVVLHLTPLFPFGYRPEIESDLTDQLKVLVPEDAGDWCRLEFVVRFEFAAEGILQVAEERQSDLIVMGVRKASALAASHSPWETASEVVSKACCPVITVRA